MAWVLATSSHSHAVFSLLLMRLPTPSALAATTNGFHKAGASALAATTNGFYRAGYGKQLCISQQP